ncbi:hypothetical protein BLA39750_01160 [Burkholderia lata]|uniref:Conjugal transfer protein TrbB n=1 Tax=Burkholderia lata (strain ATCC 17760 / DSM 23089 / LMG 22485 / NCIMB 9086 / R18194 / 383) TaxID=482957 RepID=A0A6P2V9U7_BURL3|nr:hypothetical protein [Burkholderia lata]VWC80468.1 hypothetical protein BLA39750_01160 [Burkholderia lata]
MPSVFLSKDTFNQLKRVARQQLPSVRHTHVLEALARAVGQSNFAALTSKLAASERSGPSLFVFSYEDMRRRLSELGYPDAMQWSIDLSGATEVFRTGPVIARSLAALQANGILTAKQRDRLAKCISEQRTILVTGAVRAGKSLVFHALLNEMAIRWPQDEFALCQIAHDESGHQPNVTRYVRDEWWPGGIPAVGQRRLAVDDLQENNLLKTLLSWSHFRGGIGTLHAPTVDSALTLLLRVLGVRGLKYVRAGVDVLVHMENSGVPRVAEIIEQDDLVRHIASLTPPPDQEAAGGPQSSSAKGNRPRPDNGSTMLGIAGTTHHVLHGAERDVHLQAAFARICGVGAEGESVAFVDAKFDGGGR